jgi:phage terminase large subunit-like protein
MICQPRYSTPRTNRATYGPKVALVAQNLGYTLMPWQQHVLDVAMEVNPFTGLLAYNECVVTVPRQCGKTLLLLSVMVHRAQAFITSKEPDQRILYAAQKRIAARAKWEDEHLKVLDRSRYRHQYTVRKQIGQEAIRWNNGSLHGITSATETAGHGETLDLGVIDEAFAQTDSRLELAFKPAQKTRQQPQIWINSTAGTAKSTFLRSKVDSGRIRATAQVEITERDGRVRVIEAPLLSGSCYFEWSALEDADPSSPDTWRSCIPALGYTQTIERIQHEYDTIEDLRDFRRSSLNQWPDDYPDEWLVITQLEWTSQYDAASVPVGRLVFAIDTTPERSWTSIAVCGKRADGCYHLEVLAHRPGTSWAVEAMKALAAAWGGTTNWSVTVMIDSASAAAALITDLEALKHPDGTPMIEVRKLKSEEYVQACGQFYDRVRDDRVYHLGQPSLTSALAGATKRVLEASWAWARKAVQVDISPLVGVTLALWGFVNTDADDDYDVLDSVG